MIACWMLPQDDLRDLLAQPSTSHRAIQSASAQRPNVLTLLQWSFDRLPDDDHR